MNWTLCQSYLRLRSCSEIRRTKRADTRLYNACVPCRLSARANARSMHSARSATKKWWRVTTEGWKPSQSHHTIRQRMTHFCVCARRASVCFVCSKWTLNIHFPWRLKTKAAPHLSRCLNCVLCFDANIARCSMFMGRRTENFFFHHFLNYVQCSPGSGAQTIRWYADVHTAYWRRRGNMWAHGRFKLRVEIRVRVCVCAVCHSCWLSAGIKPQTKTPNKTMRKCEHDVRVISPFKTGSGKSFALFFPTLQSLLRVQSIIYGWHTESFWVGASTVQSSNNFYQSLGLDPSNETVPKFQTNFSVLHQSANYRCSTISL